MKKIMIAAAIGCATAFAHAGSFIWGLGSYTYSNHESQSLESGTAFLFLGSVGITSDGSAFDLASATFVAKGGFDFDNYGFGSLDPNALQDSALITATSGQAYTIVLTETEVDSLAGYEGYYTMVNGTSEEGQIPGTTPVKYANLVDASTPIQTSSYMSAVPEPTSGLLLLLGVAGLALKRRRA